LVDKKGVDKFCSYNLGLGSLSSAEATRSKLGIPVVTNSYNYKDASLNSYLPEQASMINFIDPSNIYFTKWLLYSFNNNTVNLSDDSKSYGNPLKTFFKSKNSKKLFIKDSTFSKGLFREKILDELVGDSKAGYYS
jgi:hypothetical protein